MRFSISTILFFLGISLVSSQAFADETAPTKADPNVIVLGDREPIVVHFKDISVSSAEVLGTVMGYTFDHSKTARRYMSSDGCTDKSYTVNGTRCTRYDPSLVQYSGISLAGAKILYEDGSKDSKVFVALTISPVEDGGYKISFPASVKIESTASLNSFFTSVFRSTKTPIYKTNEELSLAINAMFDDVTKGANSGDISIKRISSETGEYTSDYPAASLIANLSRNAGHDVTPRIGDKIDTYIDPKKYDATMSPFKVALQFYPHKNGSIAKFEIPSSKVITAFSDGHTKIDDQAEVRKKVVLSVLND